MAQNLQLLGPREGFLTYQWIITGNKQTDKYYDETKMRMQPFYRYWAYETLLMDIVDELAAKKQNYP